MTAASGAALRTAMAYYTAWTSKDMDTALSFLADDIVCETPAGRIEGVAAYREFLGPFAQMLIRTELFAAFGDDTTAVLVYDTQTPPVGSGPGAECLTVKDGRIVHNRFIFDRLPFELARKATT